MFLTPQPEKIEECKKILSQINPNNNPDNKPVVILATTSDLNNEMGLAKNLTDNHVINLVHKIREMGLFPISIHDSTQEI